MKWHITWDKMKGGIKVIKVALNQIKRKAKAMYKVRFKGKHNLLLHEIKLKGIITMQEVELRWHYVIKIKLLKGNERGQS